MRKLTLYGKVVVIKHLVMSQIVHTATAVPIPPKIIKRINKLAYTFLWNSKTEKVKRNICHNPEVEGGLGMIDLESKCRSLRLSWIHKYLRDEQSAWKILFRYWIRKIGDLPLCLHFNCKKSDMCRICRKKQLPNFYVDMFCSWADLKYIDMFKVTDIENEMIWYNSNIKDMNELLYFPNWMRNNIFKVKQVLVNGIWKEVDSICINFQENELLSAFKLAKLKSAFPNFWLQKLRNRLQYVNSPPFAVESSIIELVTGDSIDVAVMKAKHYYNLMLEQNRQDLPCIYFWNAYFDLPDEF